MSKLLTSLALVVAQVLPWASGPLFTCTSGDGSVCIDRGPEACDCCPQAALERQSCCGDDADGHVDHACLAEHAQDHAALAPASCDCTHELVASAPVVSAPRHASADVDLQVHAGAIAVGVEPLVPSMTNASGLVRVGALADCAPPVGLLSTTVLRC